MKILTGRLHWDSDQSQPCFTEYDSDNIIQRLNVESKPDVPLNILLDVVVSDDEKNLLSYRRSSLEGVRAPSNPKHRKLALVEVAPSFSNEDNTRERLKIRAKKTQDAFNRAFQSYRTIEIDTFLYKSNHKIDLNNWKLWQELGELVGDSYTHIQAVGGWKEGLCGVARLSGDIAITFKPGTCGFTTTFHEHNHNEGLMHSGDHSWEYGERDKVMGSGDSIIVSAPHLNHLGAIDGDHVVDLFSNESKTVYLAPANTLEQAIPMGADRIIVLRNSSIPRIMSISLDDDHIDIHEPWTPQSRDLRGTKLIKTLQVGETFEYNGRTIEFISLNENIAKIKIDDAEDMPEPIWPIPNGNFFASCSGIWGNPNWSVQGAHIRYLPDRNQIWLAWLTWTSNYERQWYFGTLDIEGNTASGNLYTVNRKSSDLAVDGKAVLHISKPDQGMLRIHLNNELFATPLIRISNANTDDTITGYWGLGNKNGISIERTSDGQIVGYILEIETNILGASKSNWLLHQNGIIYRPEGGFRGVKSDFELIDTGKRLTITDNGVTIIDKNKQEEKFTRTRLA